MELGVHGQWCCGVEFDLDRSLQWLRALTISAVDRRMGADSASGFHPVPAENGNAMPANSHEFSEILHGLNNVLVSIVLHAQIMEWKLPSYSRMRRNTHEIQRRAQRAGVLLKRLAGRTEATGVSDAVTDASLEASDTATGATS